MDGMNALWMLHKVPVRIRGVIEQHKVTVRPFQLSVSAVLFSLSSLCVCALDVDAFYHIESWGVVVNRGGLGEGGREDGKGGKEERGVGK